MKERGYVIVEPALLVSKGKRKSPTRRFTVRENHIGPVVSEILLLLKKDLSTFNTLFHLPYNFKY